MPTVLPVGVIKCPDNRDIFQVLDDGEFEAIWMQQAIQHIHPAEDFLLLALVSLKPGGTLVISDPRMVIGFSLLGNAQLLLAQ